MKKTLSDDLRRCHRRAGVAPAIRLHIIEDCWPVSVRRVEPLKRPPKRESRFVHNTLDRPLKLRIIPTCCLTIGQRRSHQNGRSLTNEHDQQPWLGSGCVRGAVGCIGAAAGELWVKSGRGRGNPRALGQPEPAAARGSGPVRSSKERHRFFAPAHLDRRWVGMVYYHPARRGHGGAGTLTTEQ